MLFYLLNNLYQKLNRFIVIFKKFVGSEFKHQIYLYLFNKNPYKIFIL